MWLPDNGSRSTNAVRYHSGCSVALHPEIPVASSPRGTDAHYFHPLGSPTKVRSCFRVATRPSGNEETKAKHAGSGTICRTMRRTTCVRPRSHSTRPTVVTGDGVRRDTTQWRLLELIISFGAALGRQLKQLLFVEDQIAAASARLGNIRRPR